MPQMSECPHLPSRLPPLQLVIVHRKLGQLAEERMRLVRAAIEVVVLLTEDEVDAVRWCVLKNKKIVE